MNWRHLPLSVVIAVVVAGCGGAAKTRPATAAHRFMFVSSAPLPPVGVGAPVRVGGVEVGRVVARRGGQIDFVLIAQPKLAHEPGFLPAIRRDARVRIRPRLFLSGAYYLELSPGSSRAPLLPDGGIIRGVPR